MKNMVSKWTASLLAAALLVSSPLTAMAAELSSSEAADKETAESEQGIEAVEDVLLSEEISDVKLSDVQEIPEGVSIGDIEVGGLTGEEAAALVAEYFDQAGEATVRFLVDAQSMEKTLDELGLYWKNEGDISRTLYDVSRGNLLKQYKLVKDIENDMLDTEIQFAVEEEAAVALLDEDLLPLNVEPVNATFSRNSAGG